MQIETHDNHLKIFIPEQEQTDPTWTEITKKMKLKHEYAGATSTTISKFMMTKVPIQQDFTDIFGDHGTTLMAMGILDGMSNIDSLELPD